MANIITYLFCFNNIYCIIVFMKEQMENFIEPVFINLNIDSKYLNIESSDRKELADYQINSVFSIAKETFRNPRDIGEEIVREVNKLENFNDYFESVTFCLPGFINIKASNKLITKYLNKAINEGNLGIEKTKSNILYFLDYGGPNIAKPLHIGHIRPAIIGESLKKILNIKGYRVISDAHLGDIGLQIGQVIYGILKDKPKEITLEYLEKTYPKVSALTKENPEILKECQKILKELQDGNKEYLDLWKKIYDISIKEIKRIYEFLSVDFDLWLGESDSYNHIPKLISYLESKSLIVTDEGAKVVKVSEEEDDKNMPPVILEKSDGAYLYATTDLATIYDRVKTYNPDYILYVVDARQSLHFEQIFRVCEKSGLINKDKLEHIAFGTINGPDGKPFKTRSGDTLKLIDLFDMVKEAFLAKKEANKLMNEEDIRKIINAIIKFSDLQNNREKNYIFDVAKFSDVNGKTGPYILYTALRIKKLLIENNFEKNNISENIYNENDRDLRMKLLELDKCIEKSIANRYPHFIAEYLYDLAVISNTFYQNNNILNLKDNTQKNDWLNLLNFAYNVIETCLNLLAIEIPSKM